MSQNQTSLPCALVIEDDDHIGQLLQFMLEREQYNVHLAKDGRAGKAFIENEPPPAIALLDVMLPFFDGFQLVALVRAQPGWESVPVIMLTAKTQERDIVRALDAGANDYIVKPFQPKELLARVRRLAKVAP
jgi:DNA-binding response OmpR family regulator